MRFAPKVSVRARLTLTLLLVICLSWVLSTGLVMHFALQEAEQVKQRVLQGKELIPPSTRRFLREHPMLTQLWQVTYEDHTFVLLMPLPVGRGLFLARILIAVLLSFLVAVWISRRLTRPLAALETGAQAFHGGELSHRIPTTGSDEFTRVATTMNAMADQVSSHIASLEADGRRRQQLLADVAHELHSPVANLRTMAEAVRDDVADAPERRALALNTMVETTTRLQGLITDLLELARLDLHEFPLNLERIDIRALACEVVAAHQTAAKQAGLTLHPTAVGDPVWVQADAHRLMQVLTNLLTNAISYAGSGAEVRVTLARKTGVLLAVEDNGRGIPEEHFPFLFDPFYRADAVRTPGDTHSGLGLRITRGLVEAHGGTLTLESRVGYGTVVAMHLPAAEPRLLRLLHHGQENGINLG